MHLTRGSQSYLNVDTRIVRLFSCMIQDTSFKGKPMSVTISATFPDPSQILTAGYCICDKQSLVPQVGLEPTRISPPEPKSGASTNFATRAFCILVNFGSLAKAFQQLTTLPSKCRVANFQKICWSVGCDSNTRGTFVQEVCNLPPSASWLPTQCVRGDKPL